MEHNWAQEFHSPRGEPHLDLDRVWEDPHNIHFPPRNFHHSPGAAFDRPMHHSAKEMLESTKWGTEFEQHNKTELMATAEEFLNSMSDPTIKATEFMKFVEKLSTGETSVQETRNESQPNLADAWANEFEAQAPISSTSRSDKWTDEFVVEGGSNIDSEALNDNEKQEFWQKLESEWDRISEESGYQHPWLSGAAQQFEQVS